MIWLWVGFLLFVAAMLALDLGVINRKAHVVSLKESLTWSAVWIAMGVGFTAVVYFLYAGDYFGIASHDAALAARYPGLMPESPSDAAWMYITGYLTEKSLSVDNIFVIAIIFAHFRIPALYQHGVLFWGILGAVVLRGVFILVGAGLIQQFHFTIYIFGAILLITGIKLLFAGGEPDPAKSRITQFIYRHFPVTDQLHGDRFWINRAEMTSSEHLEGAPDPWARRFGKVLTPLGLALLVVEATDVIFAFDSIPAIFGLTADPFLVYTSNIFAILGLRALYFALAGIIRKFHHLQTALALVLLFIASKMLLTDVIHDIEWLGEAIPYITFAVILLCIAGGVIASLLLPAPEEAHDENSTSTSPASAGG